MLKFSSGECSLSLPCQVDVPCQDEMRDAGATPGDRDLLSKQFFTQLDPVLDYLTIWTLCFLFFLVQALFVEQMSPLSFLETTHELRRSQGGVP